MNDKSKKIADLLIEENIKFVITSHPAFFYSKRIKVF